jgi:hypothetical protein
MHGARIRARRTLAVLTAAFAAICAVTMAPTPARADSSGWKVWYISVLKPANSDGVTRVLDVTNGSTANGTPVQLWQLTSGNTENFQQWGVRARGLNGNGYEIYNWGSGKCLDRRSDVAIGNGNPVQMWQCNSQDVPARDNQLWYPVKIGNSNWVELTNGVDGRCLDVTNFSNSNGARLQVWDCLGNWNQRWNIYP